ncbi:MAG: immunoglobulin domain-containing protein, partial [Crocinitomicaceae bacterium]|nr:immunoglobulin domain-containing protein [Crocinitomicaceae bacterium]
MRNLIVALFACIGISFHVFSQVVTPFTIRKTLTQKGGILFLSNSSSRANPANIVQNQIPPSGTGYNNSFTNTYIDIDNDATTWMSSSDQLNLPTCTEISWAGLYWGADCSLGDENYATRNSVKLKVDNGSYMDLTADEIQDNTVGYKTYHCFKDITSIVQANSLTSNYTIANMAGDINGKNLFGGWTIVVMYKNNTMTMRNLTVFNGLANVSSAAPIVDIPISGFQTPLSGPVTFELGLVLYDGDRSLTGDQLMFKGASAFVNISDAIHSTTDVFNSTLSRNGVLTPLRNPSYNNTLGYDANIFSPNNTAKNYIGNNAVSAVIRQTTGGEFFLTQVVTSAIDVYEPDLRAAVRVTNVTNPGAALAQSGDILEYTVTGLNIGSDPSVNTFIMDTIEGNAFYVPGSLSIVHGPNAGPLSDALGDDQGEYLSSSKTIKVRMGTGANSFLGGLVNNSPSGADSTQFKFRTQVTSDCVYLSCDGIINNKAFIIGTGNVSGNTFSNASNPGVFDGNGCAISGTTATPVNVSGCGPITASANSPICQGGSINFTSSYSPAATYVWTGPNGFLSNIHNPTINNVQAVNAGTYIANIYITGTPCHFVYPFVADISIAQAGTDQTGLTTCGLTQVTLAGNNPAGTSGVWTIISGTGGSFGSGNTSTSTQANATFNGVSGNTYVLRWTLTSPGCSPTIDDVTVTFLQAPTAATLTGVSATCSNQLSATITGGVSPYTLNIDNGVGTVNNYISGTNISVSPNATTTYTLSTVTGANGCQLALTSSNTATITVSSSVSGGVIAATVPLSFTSGNSGQKYPTANSVISSGNNDNAGWTNPANAYTDNGSAATATGDKHETKFLYLRNFGFSIPSNAVIDGVIVNIDKKRENNNKKVFDNKVTLVATTTTLGSNQANTSLNWPTDYTVSTYGSSTDMWGNTTSTLTPAVINGSTFGLGLAAKLDHDNSKAYIDYASITVHYHIGNNSYCDTESGVSFSISGVTGATSYNWVPPTGATIT